MWPKGAGTRGHSVVLSPCPAVLRPMRVAWQVTSVGQRLRSGLWAVVSSRTQLGWRYLEKHVGCRAPQSIAVLQRRGCVTWEQPLFFFLPSSLAQLPPPLLSAAVWIWQQVCGPGLKWGLFILGGGDLQGGAPPGCLTHAAC